MQTDYHAILKEAHEAAAMAQLGMVDSPSMRPGDAWVTCWGNEALVVYCRKVTRLPEATPNRDFDRATWLYGKRAADRGWRWHRPGGYQGESFEAHLAGATAFSQVLSRYRIQSVVSCQYMFAVRSLHRV